MCYIKLGEFRLANKKRSTPEALGRAPLNGRMTGSFLPQHTSAGVLYD
ncbi:hypothetical protein [Paenibacillus terrae]|nr:hypothetical protein [Paenibacillus terrae]